MFRLVLQLNELAQSDYSYDWWLFLGTELSEQGTCASQEDFLQSLERLIPDVSKRSELIVLPPSHRIHYRLLEVPKQQLRHIHRLTPYLMEPFIGEALETMHFVARREKNSGVFVAGVSAELMEHWQDISQSAQFISSFVLPPQYFVALETSQQVALEGDLMAVSHMQICHVPEVLRTSQEDVKQISVVDIVALLNKDSQWRQASLLQGAFSNAPALGKGVARWAWVAGLCIIALLVQTVFNYQQADALNQEAYQVEQAGAQAFLKLAPEEGRVVNLNRQIQARLNGQMRSPEVQRTPYEFLVALEEASAQLTLGNGLQQVSYRDGGYRFEWIVANRSQLERLQNQLREAGFQAQLAQVIRSDQSYRGIFVVQGGL